MTTVTQRATRPELALSMSIARAGAVGPLTPTINLDELRKQRAAAFVTVRKAIEASEAKAG